MAVTSEFVSSSEAYRVARERASVAAAFEADLLHLAVFDAREAGMSVREAAAALNVSKSTVGRHWRDGHRCTDVLPTWGSDAAWRDAHAAVWAHNPRELAIIWVPYEWRDELESRTIRRMARGTARFISTAGVREQPDQPTGDHS